MGEGLGDTKVPVRVQEGRGPDRGPESRTVGAVVGGREEGRDGRDVGSRSTGHRGVPGTWVHSRRGVRSRVTPERRRQVTGRKGTRRTRSKGPSDDQPWRR